jgi:hypothetical protein
MSHKFLQPNILLPSLAFAALLFVGLKFYGDYGITWDDPDQRQLGLVTFDYVTGKTDSITENANPLYDNRYHNPFIELIGILPEKILDSHSLRTDFLLKHFTVFIFSWIGFIFFYLLAFEILSDYRWALIAWLMLILTPRIFAHSFFNSKDIPVLFLFVICVYCFIKWIKKPVWLWLFLLTLTSGLLTGARIIGLMMPVLVIMVTITLQLTGNFKKEKWLMLFVYLFALSPGSISFLSSNMESSAERDEARHFNDEPFSGTGCNTFLRRIFKFNEHSLVLRAILDGHYISYGLVDFFYCGTSGTAQFSHRNF